MKCSECNKDCSSVKHVQGKYLCYDCKQKLSINKDGIFIVSEALLYMTHHLNNSSKESIKKVVCEYFHDSEVSYAQRMLWEACKDKLPPVEQRRTTASRSAKEAEDQDVLFALEKLDRDDVEIPKVYAEKLDRIPKFGPEEVDVYSVVERLSEIEKTLKTVKGAVKSHEDTITTLLELQCERNSYASVAKSAPPGTRPQMPGKTNVLDVNSILGDGRTSYDDVPLALGGSRPLPNDGTKGFWSVSPRPQRQKAPISRHQSREHGPVRTPISIPAAQVSSKQQTDTENNDFKIPKEQVKRHARRVRRTVFGKSFHGSLKGAPRFTDLFVFRLHKESDCEMLENYMASKDIAVMESECISNEASQFKSFRLRINYNDFENVMSESFWPEGVGCRKYIRPRVAKFSSGARIPTNEAEQDGKA